MRRARNPPRFGPFDERKRLAGLLGQRSRPGLKGRDVAPEYRHEWDPATAGSAEGSAPEPKRLTDEVGAVLAIQDIGRVSRDHRPP